MIKASDVRSLEDVADRIQWASVHMQRPVPRAQRSLSHGLPGIDLDAAAILATGYEPALPGLGDLELAIERANAMWAIQAEWRRAMVLDIYEDEA